MEIFHWHALEGYLEKTYDGDPDGGWAGLLWGGGSTTVPTGTPACGWDMELCPPEPPNLVLPISAGEYYHNSQLPHFISVNSAGL